MKRKEVSTQDTILGVTTLNSERAIKRRVAQLKKRATTSLFKFIKQSGLKLNSKETNINLKKQKDDAKKYAAYFVYVSVEFTQTPNKNKLDQICTRIKNENKAKSASFITINRGKNNAEFILFLGRFSSSK